MSSRGSAWVKFKLQFLPAFLLLYVSASPFDPRPTASLCRWLSGGACGPSESEWVAFNQSINVCHGELFAAAKCTELQGACNPFAQKDSQYIVGTYIQYAVTVALTSDIQKTIGFAKDTNLHLVIRNTGHNYLGKFSGSGALGIWTHHLRSFDVLDYKSLYYVGKAAKFGAGIQIEEGYPMEHAKGLTIVSGSCPTVGLAGGYTQGGGLGYLTSKYGYGANRLLEWDALSGDVRGAYPTPRASLAFRSQGVSLDDFYYAVKTFLNCLPKLSDAGGAAVWGVQSSGFGLAPAVGLGFTKENLGQISSLVMKRLGELNIAYGKPLHNFYGGIDPDLLAMVAPAASSYFQIGGGLIPRSVITSDPDGLVNAIHGVNSYGAGVGGASAKAPKSSFANSVNPALRDSEIYLSIRTYAMVTGILVPMLEKLTPNGGSAYLNEGDSNDEKWQDVFYGTNYASLRRAKRRFDPEGLLWGRTSVGSEDWVEKHDGRLCQV
ncbi:hypothetical protein B0O99DRAFT_656999 [Bisporella sp. PMI_857]|nr:hypothetical protein B0O99DRAFT_656999 [Bisporella sp. PMI_857]